MIRRFLALFIGLGLFLVISLNSAMASPGAHDYRIGAGDVLSISVWKDESLTRKVAVLPDGTVSFPLIGRVQAEGMRLEDLKQDIHGRLIKFVPDPILSIEVVRLSSLVIYVVGKVNRAGRFEITDNINVLQAIAQAGGLNPFAKSGDIKIFRESSAGTKILPFDYGAVSKGKHMEQNIRLQRGDVIVVP